MKLYNKSAKPYNTCNNMQRHIQHTNIYDIMQTHATLQHNANQASLDSNTYANTCKHIQHIQTMQQRANSMQNKNANRRANNAQQDANRDATAKPRTVAGGNKQPTGQGAARYDKRADPDDVQRGQNAAQSNANAQGIDRNAQEIERLKALAYGRR